MPDNIIPENIKVLIKNITDNDVADACGIGHWAVNNLGKAINGN